MTRQRFSANSIYPPPLGGSIRTLGTAQASALVGVRFLRPQPRRDRSGGGLERAAQADKDAARVMLASNVARTYVQLGRLFEQREVAARSLQQRDEILSLIKQRVQGGLDTNVELRQGEGALPETRQQIEQLDEQIALTRHALAALTAQAPNALDGLIVPLSTVQAVPLPAAVPADLLGRRADITAARWRIEAATSDMKSAKAQFYPNINLTAFVGLASIGLNQLIKAGSEQYGAGPAIRLPIFDSGRLRANLRGKTADLDAAIESYNGAVLDAVHDVADQISSLRSIDRQQAEQASAQAAAESAYDLATQALQSRPGHLPDGAQRRGHGAEPAPPGGRSEGACARRADRADPGAGRRLRPRLPTHRAHRTGRRVTRRPAINAERPDKHEHRIETRRNFMSSPDTRTHASRRGAPKATPPARRRSPP